MAVSLFIIANIQPKQLIRLGWNFEGSLLQATFFQMLQTPPSDQPTATRRLEDFCMEIINENRNLTEKHLQLSSELFEQVHMKSKKRAKEQFLQIFFVTFSYISQTYLNRNAKKSQNRWRRIFGGRHCQQPVVIQFYDLPYRITSDYIDRFGLYQKRRHESVQVPPPPPPPPPFMNAYQVQL